MALKIDRGLFNSDFVDNHAILGVAVDADPKNIRKRYLKIARQLHPDSSSLKNDAERQLAQELLSKLVNPAYKTLSQEKELKEYSLLLDLKGKQLNKQQDTVILTSRAAQKLATAGDVSAVYQSELKDLVAKQYESLNDSLEVIGQISELNMVYLMRQSRGTAPAPPRPGPGPGPRPTPKPPPDLVQRAVGRAIEFESQGDFPRAIQELREAIQMNPTHAKIPECHARLANIYFKTKQPTMAKIHARKSLELDSKNELARTILNRVDPTSNGKSGKTQTDKGKAPADKSKGGLFGLFGGKKK